MKKKQISGETEIGASLRAISDKILAKHPSLDGLALVGIRTRGVYIAERLKKILGQSAGVEIPSGIMDITLYRDDLTSIGPQPVVNSTIINFDVSGKKIILVDDVFYTGRTMRAALDELMDFGRPALVEIAVLVDRDRRELPVHPDYTGMKLETEENETIRVAITETDGRDRVFLAEET